ncbi:MAG: hypothetical protein ABR502_01365 [Chitinophagaceae bacterium]
MSEYAPEDLVLYLYKETSLETTASIEEALQNNWTLREKLAVLEASKDRLTSAITSPRKEVLLSIFKYASEKETVNL